MTKHFKVLFGVFAGMFLISFIMYKALCNIKDDTPTPIVYPKSTLSDNLFVSQNTDYVAQEDYDVPYDFMDVPYVVDLPSGDTADVGSGHIVAGNDSIVFYVSQIEDTVSPHDAVLSQYPPVVYINYSKDASYAQTVLEDYGYMNGMAATYFVDHLLISTGSSQSARNAYVLGYCFDLGEKYPYNVMVSIATTTESTEAFEACKVLLDSLAMTVRYDAELDAIQQREREQLAKEEAEAKEREEKQKQQDALDAKKAQEDILKSKAESASSSYSAMANEKVLPITVDKDFSNLSILVTWDNEVEGVLLSFKSKDGTVHVTPEHILSKQAIIDVGPCTAGEYQLSVMRYSECNNLSFKLIENS